MSAHLVMRGRLEGDLGFFIAIQVLIVKLWGFVYGWFVAGSRIGRRSFAGGSLGA